MENVKQECNTTKLQYKLLIVFKIFTNKNLYENLHHLQNNAANVFHFRN